MAVHTGPRAASFSTRVFAALQPFHPRNRAWLERAVLNLDCVSEPRVPRRLGVWALPAVRAVQAATFALALRTSPVARFQGGRQIGDGNIGPSRGMLLILPDRAFRPGALESLREATVNCYETDSILGSGRGGRW